MTVKAKHPCDLHTHTVRSDGNDTYAQLIDAACAAGIKILAITDHDMVPAETVSLSDGRYIPLAEYAKQRDMHVIPGIEFSCDTDADDVHILGYGCNFGHSLFKEERRLSDESKINAYKELVSRLAAQGIPISWRQVLNDAKTPRKENEVQRKHIFELMAIIGCAPSWKHAKLMVIEDAQLNVRRRKPDPLEIIRLLHNTGGIAVLAHPFLIARRLPGGTSRDEYIENLIRGGLDGIEAAYPYEKTSYGGRFSSLEIEKKVRNAYSGRLPVISGGSDYHNEAAKGLGAPRLIGEKGVGMEYFMSNPLLRRLLPE